MPLGRWRPERVPRRVGPGRMAASAERNGRHHAPGADGVARPGRQGGIAIASYLGGSDVLDRAIADFADAYADQNERDFEALTDAAASGRVTAERGV